MITTKKVTAKPRPVGRVPFKPITTKKVKVKVLEPPAEASWARGDVINTQKLEQITRQNKIAKAKAEREAFLKAKAPKPRPKRKRKPRPKKPATIGVKGKVAK